MEKKKPCIIIDKIVPERVSQSETKIIILNYRTSTKPDAFDKQFKLSIRFALENGRHTHSNSYRCIVYLISLSFSQTINY